MRKYFVISPIFPTFVYELFETMQSSVIQSRTSISKSLPASFLISLFVLFSESYIEIFCFTIKNYKIHIIRVRIHIFAVTKNSEDEL